jgi:transcriptional regulator with XRE-family HTH domain
MLDVVDEHLDVEAVARARIRSVRQALGWSLDLLAERSHLSASTISRIENGKRTLSLDVLVALARALQVDVGALIDTASDDDVVIRPVSVPAWPGSVAWPLSRSTSDTIVMKIRLEPSREEPEPKVHAGHDWFHVLSGTVHLTLGDRVIAVEAGEAAEFSTMIPHAMRTVGAPAELIMIFDRHGRDAHLDVPRVVGHDG